MELRIIKPDPIDAIVFRMEEQGLRQADSSKSWSPDSKQEFGSDPNTC